MLAGSSTLKKFALSTYHPLRASSSSRNHVDVFCKPPRIRLVGIDGKVDPDA